MKRIAIVACFLTGTLVVSGSANSRLGAASKRVIPLYPHVELAKKGDATWDITIGSQGNEDKGDTAYGWKARWDFRDVRLTSAKPSFPGAGIRVSKVTDVTAAEMGWLSRSQITFPCASAGCPDAAVECPAPDTVAGNLCAVSCDKVLGFGLGVRPENFHIQARFIWGEGKAVIVYEAPGVHDQPYYKREDLRATHPCDGGNGAPTAGTLFYTQRHLLHADPDLREELDNVGGVLDFGNEYLFENFRLDGLFRRCEKLYVRYAGRPPAKQVRRDCREFSTADKPDEESSQNGNISALFNATGETSVLVELKRY